MTKKDDKKKSYFSNPKQARAARAANIQSQLPKLEQKVVEYEEKFIRLMARCRKGGDQAKFYLNQAQAAQGMAMGFVVRMNAYLDELSGGTSKHRYSLDTLWKRTVPLDNIEPTLAKGDPVSRIQHMTAKGKEAEKRERARLARLRVAPINPTTIANKINSHERLTGEAIPVGFLTAIEEEDRPVPKREKPAFSYLKDANTSDALPHLERILAGQRLIYESHLKTARQYGTRGEASRANEYSRHAAQQKRFVDATKAAIEKLIRKPARKSPLPKPALPSNKTKGARARRGRM